MSNRAGRLAVVLVAALASAWALLIVSAPWLAAARGAGGTGTWASALTYLLGSLLCHQQPARSFHLAGAQLPVCARCTGLYLAGAIGSLAGLWAMVSGWREPASSLARRFSWRAVLLGSAVPLAASVGLQWAGLWAGSNASRALTSIPAGWAVGAMLARIIHEGPE